MFEAPKDSCYAADLLCMESARGRGQAGFTDSVYWFDHPLIQVSGSAVSPTPEAVSQGGSSCPDTEARGHLTKAIGR